MDVKVVTLKVAEAGVVLRGRDAGRFMVEAPLGSPSILVETLAGTPARPAPPVKTTVTV